MILPFFPSRSRLFIELERSAILLRNGDIPDFSLLVIDLDNFKQINRLHGHKGGDQLLQQIAQRLEKIGQQGQVAISYMGGDEFAVLCHEAGTNDAVQPVINDINRVFGEPFQLFGEQIRVNASIGVAHAPTHADEPSTLMCSAESAMYAAKRMGLDYSVFDPGHSGRHEEQNTMEWELRMALYSEQLEVYFQPKVAMKSYRLQGVEALIRWQHSTRGLLSPEIFIPVAERNGLIRSLTRWVLNAAIRQCATWKSKGIYVPISVNLSSADLGDPELADYIAQLLQAWEIGGNYLEIEITETMAIDNYDVSQTLLNRLREMGVQITVDDFGTGYSSLTHLKHLPVDNIKIDKSFVLAMSDDHHDAQIVNAITQLGHRLGKLVVAEGVNNQKNWNMLIEAGCDQAQGFHISHPLPADEITQWLHQAANAGASEPYWH